MSKAEKILDKILGIIFFLAFIGLLIYGSLQLSSVTPKKTSPYLSPPKEIIDTIEVECVRCGQINKRSIMVFKKSEIDTIWKK